MEFLEQFTTRASDFGIDQCLVNISYTGSDNIYLYTLHEECYKCDQYQKFDDFSIPSFKYDTTRVRKWQIRTSDEFTSDNDSVICNLTPNLGEFGEYLLHIFENNTCSLETVKEPVNIYLPLLIIPILLALSLSIPPIFSLFKKKGSAVSSSTTNWVASEETSTPVKKSQRVVSIDTFRGISITMMIFVNNGAGKYVIIDHAVWNGLHIADIIFPSFLWIMGFCMPISINSQLKKHFSRCEIFSHIIKRSIILFFLGLMVNTVVPGPNLETIRIFGVLQRFAISYLFVGIIILCLTKRAYDPPKSRFEELFEDLFQLFPQWIVVLALVITHTCLIFLMEVPGCPKGYLGPGGWHDHGKYFNCTGGVTRYIDDLILGSQHMYPAYEVHEIYGSLHHDPEGILGCLTTIFQVFLGVHAGTILQTFKSNSGKIYRWLIWAIIIGLLGGILCWFQQEDGWIPVNKNLWSFSFVLVTSSIALILFTFCFIIIDVYNLWSGQPFVYPGMNATIMYVGHSVCLQMFPFRWSYGLMNTHWMVLIENLWSTIAWIIVGFCLWKNKFFLKI